MSTLVACVALLFLLAGLAAYVFNAAWVAEQCAQAGLALFVVATFTTKKR